MANRNKALAAPPPGFSLRVHRALSWLRRAEAAGDDDDIAFICQWIAFNAVYAQDVDGFSEQQGVFRQLVQQVCDL